jgi:hypothetical protein
MSQPATPDVPASDQTPLGLGMAAHAYQPAMQQQSATPTSAASPAADMVKDVVMSDRTPDRPAVGQPPQSCLITITNNAQVPRNGSWRKQRP